MERVRQLLGQSQLPHAGTNPATELRPEDRRLLLRASLRLLDQRCTCGKPILQDDVLRLAALADDALERRECPLFTGRRAGA